MSIPDSLKYSFQFSIKKSNVRVKFVSLELYAFIWIWKSILIV